MRQKRVFILMIGLAVLVAARPARSQTTAERLARARGLITLVQPDSALQVLSPVFRESEVPRERAMAFLLAGAAYLQLNDFAATPQSLQAFERAVDADTALRADPELEIDVPGVRAEFERIRTERLRTLAPPAPALAPLGLALAVMDTLVEPDGSIGIGVTPTRAARVQVEVTSADSGRTVWQDSSALTDGEMRLGWPVRSRAATPIPDGRYTVRAIAFDAAGAQSELQQVTITVQRVTPDTLPFPQPPTVLPETAYSRRASPAVLVGGLVLAGAAVFLPTALGNAEINTGLKADMTAYAVGGGIAIGSIVGWVSGRRQAPIPDNIVRNQRGRDDYRLRAAQVSQANARARESAGFRVQAEGAQP